MCILWWHFSSPASACRTRIRKRVNDHGFSCCEIASGLARKCLSFGSGCSFGPDYFFGKNLWKNLQEVWSLSKLKSLNSRMKSRPFKNSRLIASATRIVQGLESWMWRKEPNTNKIVLLVQHPQLQWCEGTNRLWYLGENGGNDLVTAWGQAIAASHVSRTCPWDRPDEWWTSWNSIARFTHFSGCETELRSVRKFRGTGIFVNEGFCVRRKPRIEKCPYLCKPKVDVMLTSSGI